MPILIDPVDKTNSRIEAEAELQLEAATKTFFSMMLKTNVQYKMFYLQNILAYKTLFIV